MTRFAFRTLTAAALACAALLLASSDASATTVMKFDARTAVARAAAVVIATPTLVETLPHDTPWGTREVFTYTTCHIDRSLAGPLASGGTVVLKQMGGAYADEDLVTYEEVPYLQTGSHYVLVLAADREAPWGCWFLQSRGYGAWLVSEAGDGTPWLTRGSVSAESLPYGERTPEDVVTLDAFEKIVDSTAREPLPAEFASAPPVPDAFSPGTGERVETRAGQYVLWSPPSRWVECDTGGEVIINYNDSAYDWGGSLAEHVDYALAQWSGVPNSRLRARNGGPSTACGFNAANYVSTVSGDCYNEVEGSGCYSGVIAHGGPRTYAAATTVVNGTSFRTISSGDVVLNSGPCDLGTNGIRGVIMHELGHVLGFQHSSTPGCCVETGPGVATDTPTMRGSLYQAGFYTLAGDDWAAVRFVYPAPPGPPHIDSIAPTAGERATMVTLHVYGTDLVNGTTSVTVSGNGISPAPAISSGSTATNLIVSFGIASSATVSTRTLAVTTSLGTASKPFDVVAILAPSDLAAAPVSSTSIRLTWSDRSRVESGYKVQRYRGSDATWVLVATLPAGATTFTETGLTSGRNYKYRVRVYNATDSANSNQVQVTTP